MEKVAAASEMLAPASDEIVIYYYRGDEDYEPWGFWLWAPGSGDGSLNYEYSKDLSVEGGVGYFKFKADGSDIGQSALNKAGEIAFIRRADSGWEGQTIDLIWSVTDKGNEVVLFEDTLEPTQPGEYIPEFRAAIARETNLLTLSLSGKHALSRSPSDNDFTVQDSEGRTIEITDMANMRSVNDRSKNYASNVYVYLAEDIDVAKTYTISHPEYVAPAKIDISKLVLAAIDETTPAEDYELGAIYRDGSVEFRIWTPYAQSVTVLLFDESIAVNPNAEPVAEVPLNLAGETGVWTGSYGDRDPDGMFYVYQIDHGDETRLALDPYAKSMDAYLNEGGNGRAAIVNPARTALPGGWNGLENAQDGGYYQKREDAIIYEVSVRDFTISPDAGVRERPGSYAAFIEKLPYLRDMGVTHIQLMPVLNFYYTNETDTSYDNSGETTNSNYNWGYDPHNYFTPEGWFSSDPADPYSRIVELKQLVQAAHEQGLRVLLDVVYNHSGSTNFLEHIVPGYFFRRAANGTFTSASGVGNDFASTRKMGRKLIVDSVTWLMEEYKIDGFRFDLMGLTDTETMQAAYDAARAIKPDVLFEGEGWKMYNGPVGTKGTDQNYMTSTDDIAVFNDEIRDLLKGGGFNEEVQAFITGGSREAESIYSNLTGRPLNNYQADDPGDSMLYIAAHDGLTLADAIAHNLELSTKTASGRSEIARRAKLGNFLILTGQGIAFLHAGQERGRSKPNINNSRNETIGRFVRNSYDSADNINQFLWNIPAEYEELLAFTRGLIAIRRQHDIFRLGSSAEVEQAAQLIPQEGNFTLAYRLSRDGRSYYILVNSAEETRVFDLGSDLDGAVVLADGRSASPGGLANPSGVRIDGNSISLDPLTPALLLLESE